MAVQRTDPERGRLLYLAEIMERTGMPEGTIRSKRHRGELPCVWRLGRYLVAWEKDLDRWLEQWLEQQRATTTKGDK